MYDEIVDQNLLIRRLNIVACRIAEESHIPTSEPMEQLDLFSDYGEQGRKFEEEAAEVRREKRRQQAMLAIKKKYGKNAILKGMNLEEGATAKDRNAQIGGHKA